MQTGIQSHPDCPGQTGVALYNCKFTVPNCSFSELRVFYAYPDKTKYYSSGSTEELTMQVPSCKITGSSYCGFYSASNLVQEVQMGSNQQGAWGCDWTKP